MSKKNKTFLYDMDNNNMYMGNYKPSKSLTAHAKLANSFGLETPQNGGPHLVGGYFNGSGEMVWNSNTCQGQPAPGVKWGATLGNVYSQFGVNPQQTNPHVYYGNNVFRFNDT
jgi:hypothetical protein